MTELVQFYTDLYQSKVHPSEASLSHIDLPTPKPSQKCLLDSPISLEEIQKASSSFPTFKAPGTNNYP